MTGKKGQNAKTTDQGAGNSANEEMPTSGASAFNPEKYGLWKFGGNDYENWKFMLKLVLRDEGLEKVLDWEWNEDEEFTATNLKKDTRTMRIIASALSSTHLMYAKQSSCAADVIRKLDEIYLKKGTASRIHLKKEWQNLKMNDGGKLDQHLRRFDELTAELECAGVALTRDDIVEQLLMSMPKPYEVTVQVMEAMENLTLEVAKGKLLNQYERMKTTSSESKDAMTEKDDNTTVSFVGQDKRNYRCHKCGKKGHLRAQCRSKPKSDSNRNGEFRNQESSQSSSFRCYNCGKTGHIARNCRGKNQNPERGDGKATSNEAGSNDKASYFSWLSVDSCFLGNEDDKDGDKTVFYLDSGATSHYIKDDTLFSKSIELKKPSKVQVFKKGIEVNVTKVGTVFCDQENYSIELKNVKYSREFPANLLSVKRITQNGIEVHFKINDSVFLLKDGQVIATGTAVGEDLYKLLFNVSKQRAMLSVEDASKLWHCRLGHAGFDCMKKMKSSGLIKDMELSERFFCRCCVEGKMCKLPHVSLGIRTKRPLELIHTDLWSNPEESFDGKKYMLTFIDDFTRFVTTYLIKSKTEVFECFKEYYARCRTMFNRGIVEIRCDKGTEYINNQFKSFCRENGIRMGHTIGFNSPQSNGCAERMNRTLNDKARTMLIASGLEDKYWSEAVLCAAFVANRVPNVHGNVPAKMWYDREINYLKFKAFGCDAYLHIPKEKRENKFQERGKKLIFVGYDWSGYRLLDEETGKVVVGRDVVFEESVAFLDAVDLSPQDHQMTLQDDDNKLLIDKTEDVSYYSYLIDTLSTNVPETYSEAVNGNDSEMWIKATKEELDAIAANEVWDIVERPDDHEILSTRWIFRLKEDNNAKARLVVRGFEEKSDFGIVEIYAPVAKMSTVRLLLCLSVQFDYRVRQLDVRNAFLNGKLMKPAYIEVPDGVKLQPGIKDPVLKLNRALYGLKEAPKCWNRTLNEFLKSKGFYRSKIDDCMYTNRKVYLLIYVDDLLITGATEDVEEVVKKITERFRIRDLGEVKSFLGLRINREDGALKINQSAMIEKIAKTFGVENSNVVNTPMEERLSVNFDDLKNADVNPEVERKYRKLLGSLMYIMLGTRPDVCFAVSYFAQFQNCPNENVFNYLLRVLRYLFATRELSLKFTKLRNDIKLEVFVDADWANCSSSKRSITGYVCFISGNLIAWKSSKQSLVSLSSSDAEIIALCSAVCEGMSIRNLLNDLKLKVQDFVCYEDNENCIRFANGCTKKSKHLDVKFYFIRELVEAKRVRIEKIDGKVQIADTFTKSLGRSKFCYFREKLIC